MTVEVGGLGVVFGEGQLGAERFGLNEVAVLVHGRREFVVASDLQTDALRHFEVGILAQILDAVDEFAREGVADERRRQLGFERDDLVAFRRDREARFGLPLDDEVAAAEFEGLAIEFERDG